MNSLNLHEHSVQNEDQILEYLLQLSESEKNPDLLRLTSSQKDKKTFELLVKNLADKKLLLVKNNRLELSKAGEERAILISRGHLLAHRLMVDVLGISLENSEKAAHLMEHVLDNNILDAMCTFMGHPALSPDGKKIPPGNCCRKKLTSIDPLIVRLSDLPVGSGAVITYIQNPDRALAHMGLIPGETIHLAGRKPSLILAIGETTLALDTGIADSIFVKPLARKKSSKIFKI